MSTSVLEATQNVFEQRFNCIVCLSPRLKMVYGLCQHRVCDDCLYNNDIRRPSFDKCPTCLKEDMFPLIRPDIPEDSIEHQRCLGVRSCPHEGCTVEMWEWEMESHLMVCPNRIQNKSVNKRKTSLPDKDVGSEKRLKFHTKAGAQSSRVLRSKSLSLRVTRRMYRHSRNSTDVL
ncbi:TNF receptor-associated factor 6-like [Ylistrum balloti]|uniref:TNF receptor-associated factor 6-like n=1 Tax=Ylistrum balloti TaxID=509963 RepID=UPI0029057DEA|nr:TNF receptor-associated factor 6-like [Ylistrum balloti]